MTISIAIPRETTALSLGADDVAALIAETAKSLSHDVQIIRNSSRGASWLEPMVEIKLGDESIAYGPVSTDDVASLFEADFLSGGEHALKLGPVQEIPYLKAQKRTVFERLGQSSPLDLEAYREAGGYKGLEAALDMSPQNIVDDVKTSGLRGRGGAAFPAGIKWQTVLDAQAEQKYICCNADEGDSGTFSDRLLMEGDPFTLIEGMTIAGIAVGSTMGYIYLRSEYPLARDILQGAIDKARKEGWLGDSIRGSDQSFDIEIRMGAGAYICGEETSMLESLEGKRGQVRAKPPLPALEGLFGKPTIVNNVITLASVPYIMREGASVYESLGQNRSKGTLPFQLSGNVRRPGLIEAEFGLSLRTLIEEFGGGTLSGRPVGAVQLGGPLGAYLGPEHLDVELDYEKLAEVGGMLGHGGVVVFDDTVDLVAQARYAMEFCAEESCGKCTPCRIGSTRGVEVIDKIIAKQDAEANRELLEDLCDTMEAASLCAMGGMTPFPVRSAMSLADKQGN